MVDIFKKNKKLTFSQADDIASVKLQQIIKSTQHQLPPNFYSNECLKHLSSIKLSKLYKHLSTIPKGVCHHNHFQCNQDLQFYQQYVSSDPNVYITPDFKTLKIGTQKQAVANKWISMSQLKQQLSDDNFFYQTLLRTTTFDDEEIRQLGGNSKVWEVFESKIINFLPLIFSTKFAKHYFNHVCRKYIRNGYDRLQFRFILPQLTEYDNEGNIIKVHSYQKTKQIVEESLKEIQKDHPQFTIGLIKQFLKGNSFEENKQQIIKVCQLNWDKIIGFDFVQEEDKHKQLAEYDPIIDSIKDNKVYHAGQTRKFTNNNVEFAIKAGSVRIGHGINIVVKPFLKQISNLNICFEICPLSNIFLGYTDDIRWGSANILMNLGVPLTINPDDAGKFNCIDTTMDYFIALISYNWALKHLKLIGINSINYAICSQAVRQQLYQSFQSRWNEWIKQFISQNQ